MSKAIQVVLAAPVKLPAKVGQVVRYVAIALGILETVIGEEQPPKPDAKGEGGNGETAE